ncbi:MAG: hypothetical protein CYG61_11020 [Actinobacteria bacterium]|nr:MAG: hypothetical protein CYG61_11020 [Actinomycetota bacterium]
MTIPRSAADVLADHVTLEIECIDRMYLNVYQPKLMVEAAHAAGRSKDTYLSAHYARIRGRRARDGPRSAWATPSSSSAGICCPRARPTTNSVTTTSTSDEPAPHTRSASWPNSKPWVTASHSNPQRARRRGTRRADLAARATTQAAQAVDRPAHPARDAHADHSVEMTSRRLQSVGHGTPMHVLHG